jgi:hypothetical protein
MARGGSQVPVKDAELQKAIGRIGDHYQRNINNRFIRQALVQLTIPQSVWDNIERLTAKSEYAETNGYQLEELYQMILSAATLVSHARKHVVPNVRSLGGRPSGRPSSADRGEAVLKDMAFGNFSANLGLFADQVNELYMMTIALDKKEHGNRKCVFERIPELRDIGKLLIS